MLIRVVFRASVFLGGVVAAGREPSLCRFWAGIPAVSSVAGAGGGCVSGARFPGGSPVPGGAMEIPAPLRY